MPTVALTPHWTTSDGHLVQLYHGDVLRTLRRMPSRSVHMIVTSPPYWGLRDYSICPCRPKPAEVRESSSTLNPGGGEATPASFGKPRPDCKLCLGSGFDLSMTAWIGGHEDCDHVANGARDVHNCVCGAKRINCQLGSERVPDCLGWAQGHNCADDHKGGNWLTGCHICRMVLVFREARRVLRDDGVCWVNYGDTYAASSVNFNNGHGSKVMNPDNHAGKNEMRTTLNAQRKLSEIGLDDGNMIGVPWRFAFAMQADGWMLRSDVPWVKRAPMPESATNRAGKALEYVFMFTKGMDYFFDMDAVKPKSKDVWNSHEAFVEGGPKKKAPTDARQAALMRTTYSHNTQHPDVDNDTRNFRNSDLWFASVNEPHGMTGVGGELVGLDVTPQAYRGRHYAAYPEKLIEPLIKCSTSEAGCCAECGTQWRRVKTPASGGAIGAAWVDHSKDAEQGNMKIASSKGYRAGVTMYWEPDCACHGRNGKPERIPCTVLDNFMGSGTTAAVAAKLGRRSLGIEASVRYIEDHQVVRVTDALRSRPSLHDQIVERPRKVFQPAAFRPPGAPPLPEENSNGHGADTGTDDVPAE